MLCVVRACVALARTMSWVLSPCERQCGQQCGLPRCRVWLTSGQTLPASFSKLDAQAARFQQLVIRILAPERMNMSAVAALLLP